MKVNVPYVAKTLDVDIRGNGRDFEAVRVVPRSKHLYGRFSPGFEIDSFVT